MYLPFDIEHDNQERFFLALRDKITSVVGKSYFLSVMLPEKDLDQSRNVKIKEKPH